MLRIVLGAILIAAVAVFVFSWRGTEPVPVPQIPRPEPESAPSARTGRFEPVKPAIRDVTPHGAVQLPRAEGTRIERLPARLPPPPPPRPPQPVEWPLPIVEASGRFVSRGVEIELSGIQILPLEAQCQTQDGSSWPCGRYARTALQRLVRNRTISCDAPAQPPEMRRIVRTCRVGGLDLAQWLTEQGWADAAHQSPYSEAAAAARSAGLGMWSTAAPGTAGQR